MNTDKQISIEDLIKISKELSGSFLRSNDIYSLSLLSLMTVTTYSRKKNHINSYNRVELAKTFIPDLITALIESKIITSETEQFLRKEYEEKHDDLSSIMRSYIYAMKGPNANICPGKDSSRNKCIIV